MIAASEKEGRCIEVAAQPCDLGGADQLDQGTCKHEKNTKHPGTNPEQIRSFRYYKPPKHSGTNKGQIKTNSSI